MWRGERLLPANWRRFVTTPSGPQPGGAFGYGAGFWLLAKSEGVPADAFGGFGNRGQYMVVIPSRALVIVRQGYDDGKNRLDIAKLVARSEEHTSELQSLMHLVCRLLLEKKNKQSDNTQ